MTKTQKQLKDVKRKLRRMDYGSIKKVWATRALMVFFILGLFTLSFLNPSKADANGVAKASAGLMVAGGLAFMPWMKRKDGADRLFNGGGGGAPSLTEEQKAFLEVIKAQIKPLFATMLSDEFKPENKDALAKLTAMKDKIDGLGNMVTKAELDKLKDDLQAIGLKVEAIKEPVKSKGTDKSIAQQMKEYAEANKEEWEAFKTGKATKRFTFPVIIKAAGTMLESGNLNGSAYLPVVQMLPGVIDLVRNRHLLEQYLPSNTATSPTIVWVNKVNPDGNAEMTPEGSLKPLVDFELETETSTAKKITAAEKVSKEMLNDFAYMASMMEQELRYQVDKLADDQLLTGDGTGQNLKGITEYATAYTLTTVETTDPNNADAIIAAMAQLESLNFMGTICFVNPIDKANMKLTKTSTGERLVALNTNEDVGVTVVSSNKIPQGYFLLADLQYYKKFDLEAYNVSLGWENDDFRKNLVTMLGERRLHAFSSDNHAGAFIYDTFDNVKTAITAAP
jgi:HK97 family phage major capsid protein